MNEIFAFGTFGFWALIVAVNTFMLVCTELKSGWWATVSIVMTGVLIQLFGDISLIKLVAENPQYLLYIFIAYFATGTVWSVIKWWFYIRGERRKYDVLREEFLKENNLPLGSAIPDSLRNSFLRAMSGLYCIGIERHPQVSKHKSDIYLWIAFWPWSLIWTIINDPLKRMVDEIYAALRGFLQRMSDRVWAGTEDDPE